MRENERVIGEGREGERTNRWSEKERDKMVQRKRRSKEQRKEDRDDCYSSSLSGTSAAAPRIRMWLQCVMEKVCAVSFLCEWGHWSQSVPFHEVVEDGRYVRRAALFSLQGGNPEETDTGTLKQLAVLPNQANVQQLAFDTRWDAD